MSCYGVSEESRNEAFAKMMARRDQAVAGAPMTPEEIGAAQSAYRLVIDRPEVGRFLIRVRALQSLAATARDLGHGDYADRIETLFEEAGFSAEDPTGERNEEAWRRFQEKAMRAMPNALHNTLGGMRGALFSHYERVAAYNILLRALDARNGQTSEEEKRAFAAAESLADQLAGIDRENASSLADRLFDLFDAAENKGREKRGLPPISPNFKNFSRKFVWLMLVDFAADSLDPTLPEAERLAAALEAIGFQASPGARKGEQDGVVLRERSAEEVATTGRRKIFKELKRAVVGSGAS